VYLHSGEAFLRRVDLEIPGRGFNWRFERIYRSGWENYETPLGYNWDFNYYRRIFQVNDYNEELVEKMFPDAKEGDIVRLDGHGREDLFIIKYDKYESPPGSYTILTRRDVDFFIERDRDGNVITYQDEGVYERLYGVNFFQ